MNTNAAVERLFPTEKAGDRFAEMLNHLWKHLDCGFSPDTAFSRNPGYIFRGEADFRQPLQCSLELRVRNRSGGKIDSTLLRNEETKIISCFTEGVGGRVASIFYPDSLKSWSRTRDDVFWYLSLMQHYGLPTRLIDFTRDLRIALHFAIQQQGDTRSRGHLASDDLILYCFPCIHLDDARSNKTPFEPILGGIDMNLALGHKIGLDWMTEDVNRNAAVNNNYKRKTDKDRNDIQRWGWDCPAYQNQRLIAQKGLFVYPYDELVSAGGVSDNDSSWLVQNLAASELIRLDYAGQELKAKRIRIKSEFKDALKDVLKNNYGIEPDTIYGRHKIWINS